MNDAIVGEIIRTIVLFTIFLIVIIFSRRRSIANSIGVKKFNKNKKELVNNNQFVINNKERVSKIFDEKYKDLEPIKNSIIYSIIFFIVCLVSVFFIKNKYYTYVSIGLSVVILIINIYRYSSDSDKKFNEIALEVLHEFNSDLEYKPREGFNTSEYSICRFPETCDRFYSEDMIINLKKGFYFADILVKSEHEDSDNHTYYVTEYQGSLAKMYIKDIGCKIFLGGMKAEPFFIKNNYVSIKFENDEFNKLFMAYSDNELQAYKILTPDVMEEFVNIKKHGFGDIDIRIIDNKLYIRFLSGNGFDSSSFSKEGDKENLCQSIAVLEEVMHTMEKVKTIIDNKNID